MAVIFIKNENDISLLQNDKLGAYLYSSISIILNRLCCKIVINELTDI